MMTVPTSGNSMGKAARRLVLFDDASKELGGAAKLGDVIGCGRRAVNHKMVGTRELSDFELKLTADAVEQRARALDKLAAEIRKVIA